MILYKHIYNFDNKTVQTIPCQAKQNENYYIVTDSSLSNQKNLYFTDSLLDKLCISPVLSKIGNKKPHGEAYLYSKSKEIDILKEQLFLICEGQKKRADTEFQKAKEKYNKTYETINNLIDEIKELEKKDNLTEEQDIER